MGQYHELRIGSRRVDVYIPDDKATGPRPVLVMHDGHNLFDPALSSFGGIWAADEAVDGLRTRRPKPVIVGVWHRPETEAFPSGRIGEYMPEKVAEAMPSHNWKLLKHMTLYPLAGEAYQRTLVKRVLPSVDELAAELGIELRQDAAGRALGGSSMGGLASLYGLARYPKVWGSALAVSTHWPIGGAKFAVELARMLPKPSVGARLWMDYGTEDLDHNYYVGQSAALAELARRGYKWPQIESRAYAGWGHNEAAWQARLPEILNWWLAGF